MMTDDGGSRVFLQTTTPIEYKQKNGKKRITLTFKGTRVFLSNNQNPLVTLHFNTPLRKAYLKKARKDSQLVLELKEEAEISVMQVNIEDGYSYLFVDFPAGNWPVGGEYGKAQTTDKNSFTSDDIDDDKPAQIMDEETPFD